MDLLAPLGPVYQAGTLSGNPVSVRAGLETLKILEAPDTYDRLETAGARLEAGLRAALEHSGVKGSVNRAGSLLTLFLGAAKVNDGTTARQSDTALFARYFHRMLERLIYLPPSQFEAMFLSLAHGDAEIDATIAAATAALEGLA
jgi:glutamate-1-semialdehyde 2,1-aminomutase